MLNCASVENCIIDKDKSIKVNLNVVASECSFSRTKKSLFWLRLYRQSIKIGRWGKNRNLSRPFPVRLTHLVPKSPIVNHVNGGWIYHDLSPPWAAVVRKQWRKFFSVSASRQGPASPEFCCRIRETGMISIGVSRQLGGRPAPSRDSATPTDRLANLYTLAPGRQTRT